jgi:hypothetical protein
MEYGVYRSPLIRHVEAATKQGNSNPNVTRGRHSYLSDEVISVEKQKARAKNDRLKSRYSDQWLDYYHEVQQYNYIGGPGLKPLKFMSARTA